MHAANFFRGGGGAHHLSAWYCTNIVRRNSVLVTHGNWRVNLAFKTECNSLHIGKYFYFKWNSIGGRYLIYSPKGHYLATIPLSRSQNDPVPEIESDTIDRWDRSSSRSRPRSKVLYNRIWCHPLWEGEKRSKLILLEWYKMPGQQKRAESFEAERINLVSHSSRPYPHYAFKRRMICKNKDIVGTV